MLSPLIESKRPRPIDGRGLYRTNLEGEEYSACRAVNYLCYGLNSAGIEVIARMYCARSNALGSLTYCWLMLPCI